MVLGDRVDAVIILAIIVLRGPARVLAGARGRGRRRAAARPRQGGGRGTPRRPGGVDQPRGRGVPGDIPRRLGGPRAGGRTPPRLLLVSSVAVAAVTVALPFLPDIGSAFALVPQPGVVVASLVAVTLCYVIAAEITKRWRRLLADPLPARYAAWAPLARARPDHTAYGDGHGIPIPRQQRPQDLRDHLRQLAHPRLAGRERRRDRSACGPPSTPASPPSTPPTSTPTPRPRRCSARR